MDLRLASTYVPALVCAAKSAAIAMLARVFVPLGGASVLALVVAIDRRAMYHPHYAGAAPASSSVAGYSNPYLNMQHNFAVFMAHSTGYDINAIQAFILAASIACHERREHGLLLLTDGQSAGLAAVVLGLWMAISVVRSARPTYVSGAAAAHTSSSSYKELIAFAVLFAALMATHDSVDGRGPTPRRGDKPPDRHLFHEEEIAWAGVRAISVVACVSASMYTAQSNTLLPLLMRAAPIMLAPLTPAIGFALLVLGITLFRWNRLNSTYYHAGHHQSGMGQPEDEETASRGEGPGPPTVSAATSASLETFHKIPSPLSMLASTNPATILLSSTSSSSSGAGGGGGGNGGCHMASDDSMHALYTDITGNEQAQLREAIARQKGLLRTQ